MLHSDWRGGIFTLWVISTFQSKHGKSFLQWAEYAADSELKTLSSTIQMNTLGLAMPVFIGDSLNNCINKETNILSQCLWVSTFDFNFLPHRKCCLYITVVKHHQNIFSWYIKRKPCSRTEQTVSDHSTNCTAFHCSAACQQGCLACVIASF